MGAARDFIPALKYGHKIYPQDIAGMLSLPYVGNIYYVDPFAGSDSAGGKRPSDALATVGAAYALTTSGHSDVVVLIPSGGTGRTAESTVITWANKFTHLIGNAAPTAQDARAGMNFSGATGTATSSLSVTGNGCLFKNITLTGTDDVNVPVSITGDYNSFLGVDFKGALNATSGDDTASRALVLTGAQENYFGGCTFGADTFMRSAANATVEFASASSRNVFDACRFIMAADAETPVHVLFADTNSVDRWLEFRDCAWYAFYTNHSAKVNAALNLATQTATADVLMTGQNLFVGFDDIEAAASNLIWFPQYSTTTTLAGLPINNA